MDLNANNRFIYFYGLALFIFSALIGLYIRYSFTFPTPFFLYQNYLQSHSHVAFLGWGYVTTVAALYFFFSNGNIKNASKIALTIILISVPLMLISFPLGGYKIFSIILLVIFGLASYVVSFDILKYVKSKSIADKLIKFSIYYYLLSSLATWFLPYVMLTQGKSNLYYNTVYFYLHFLYNGFFVLALFGIFFKILEKKQIQFSGKFAYHFFLFLNIACLPAYFLSVLWSTNNLIFNGVGFLAALLQFISLIYFLCLIKKIDLNTYFSKLMVLLVKFAILSYSLKIISQIASAFPLIVKKSLALKPYFIIGYLHLFTLGFLSVFLLFVLAQIRKIKFEGGFSKIGLVIFLFSVVVTEVLLFLQGFMYFLKLNAIKNYNLLLLISSVFLVVGLIMIFISQFSKKQF
jgi:hypothetical protein